MIVHQTIERLQKKDSRIKLINHKVSKGLGESCNAGLKLAKGTYISFVDKR